MWDRVGEDAEYARFKRLKNKKDNTESYQKFRIYTGRNRDITTEILKQKNQYNEYDYEVPIGIVNQNGDLYFYQNLDGHDFVVFGTLNYGSLSEDIEKKIIERVKDGTIRTTRDIDQYVEKYEDELRSYFKRNDDNRRGRDFSEIDGGIYSSNETDSSPSDTESSEMEWYYRGSDGYDFSIAGSHGTALYKDADYIDAVERGDIETAQKMVDEAAKAAMSNTKIVDENGKPKVVYHGTKMNFTVFDGYKKYSDGIIDFAFDRSFSEKWATKNDKSRRTDEQNKKLDDTYGKRRSHMSDVQKDMRERYGEDWWKNDELYNKVSAEQDQWEKDNLGLDGMTYRDAEYDYGNYFRKIIMNG